MDNSIVFVVACGPKGDVFAIAKESDAIQVGDIVSVPSVGGNLVVVEVEKFGADDIARIVSRVAPVYGDLRKEIRNGA